jgi:hypothetical protein
VEACCAIIIMVDVGSGYKLLIYVHPSVWGLFLTDVLHDGRTDLG